MTDQDLVQPLKTMTFAELRAWLETPEGKETSYREEMQFRKGYYYGYVDAVELMRQFGADIRQLTQFVEGTLFDWWQGDCTKTIHPPDIEPWPKIRKRIIERDKGICQYCGRPNSTHVDHMQPVSRGGSYEDHNLVVACARCNRLKGRKDIDEWRAFVAYEVVLNRWPVEVSHD